MEHKSSPWHSNFPNAMPFVDAKIATMWHYTLWDAVKYWVSIINSRGEWISEQRSYFAAFDSEQGTGVTNNNGYVPSAALCAFAVSHHTHQ